MSNKLPFNHTTAENKIQNKQAGQVVQLNWSQWPDRAYVFRNVIIMTTYDCDFLQVQLAIINSCVSIQIHLYNSM